MGKNIRIGLVGYGYWGRKLARSFSTHSDCQLVAISDLDERCRKDAILIHSDASVADNYRRLLDPNNNIDAVVIATPPASQFEIALEVINAGKDIFIEKPFTTRFEDAKILVEIAERQNLVVFIDYTYLYSQYINEIKHLIKSGIIGNVVTLEFRRLKGRYSDDVDVIFDLASHDLSIIDFLFGCIPISVSATASRPDGFNKMTTAKLSISYENGMESLHVVDWMGDEKIRSLLVKGSDGAILYENNSADEYMRIFDIPLNYSMTDARISKLGKRIDLPEKREALIELSRHFLDCVSYRLQPLSDGLLGLRVMQILYQCQKSIARNGERIATGT